MRQSSKTYFYNLDATRFISFIFIFLSHVFYTKNIETDQSQQYEFIEKIFRIGGLGLDYFFVLSGFLISWIIFEEYQKTNNFKINFFWIRRSLRIWPLYFLIVFIGYSLAWVNNHFIGNSDESLPPIYYFLFFIINFYIINHGQEFLFFLVFLWSISVEEQFYFLWALILKYLKPFFVLVCTTLIGISIGFRAMNINHSNTLYFHTLSLIGNFSIGSLLAYFSFHSNKIFNQMCNVKKSTITFIYILFALNLIYYHIIYSHPILIVLEKIIFSIFFGFVILEQSFFKNSIVKLGQWKTINYLGKISYGLYCYHGLVITFFIKIAEHYALLDESIEVFFINPLIIFMFTIVVSIISYEFFEKKILKLKHKYYAKQVIHEP